jgi:hypothetical protein
MIIVLLRSFGPQLRFDELGMGEAEQTGKTVYQVVFVTIESAVCIDHLPDKLYYADSFLFRVVLVDEVCETPQVYAALSLGLGCIDE